MSSLTAVGTVIAGAVVAGASPAAAVATPQTITFNNPGTQTFGTAPTLTATATSGLPVAWSSTTTSVCTIGASSGTLTFVTAGTCSINADQAGDGTYAPAPTVTQPFTVNAVAPGPPTGISATAGTGLALVSFTPPVVTGGDSLTGFTATSNPGGFTGTCASSPCTVNGLTNGTPYTFTVTATNSAPLTSVASAASAAVTPNPAQTITFANPGSKVFGTTPTVTATTTSTSTVTFTSTTLGVCTITSGGVLTFVTAGSCTIKADAAADSTHIAATPVSQTFTVTPIAPGAPTSVTATANNASAVVAFVAPTATGGLPISSYTATSSPGALTGACATSPCTVNGLANGTVYTFTVTATNSAPLTGPASAASNSVRPGATAQTITFANPGTQNFGATPTLTATATSGLPVTFTTATPLVCTVAGNVLTFVTVGTCTINADQSGDATRASAPTVPQTFTVQKATPTIAVTSSANPSVNNQPLTFTATLTNPVTTTGTVQWSVNATNVGSAVALGATGTATFTPSPVLAVGSYIVKATYSGDPNHNTVNAQVTQVVGKANTTTAVSVSGSTLTATVAPVAPGAGTPTGTVSFTVAGVAAGSAPVGAGGVATVTASNVGNQAVAATYSGDASFLASSGNRTAIGPTVVVHVTSAHRKTAAGWYRSAVQVSFTCTPNTAPLQGTCPGPVTLSHNGAAQSVTVTVKGTDGGTTTAGVSAVNIDKTAPKLTVRRHRHHLSCHGSDALSGLASCRIHRHKHTRNGVAVVRWTATARDNAGNTTSKHGHFSYTVG